MASSISDERLREMEEEMDRFEAEIEGPQDEGGEAQGRGGGFILGANTFDRVQAQLSAIRHDMSSSGDRRQGRESSRNEYGDEDFRSHPGQKRKREEVEEEEQFFDIDERPGRPQGPPVLAPPPPPPPPAGPVGPHPGATPNMFAPPPPPPPEPDGMRGMAPPPPPRPAFMPPQLRHRFPRPPFPPRPPHGMMRMGPPGPPPHHPQGQFGPGPPQGPPRPPMMGPHMGPPMMGHQQPMAGPPPPGVEPGPFMSPGMENSNQISAGPTVVEQQKVVYAAAPVITVEKKKEKKKKKKKKTDGETSEKSGSESAGPSVSSQSSITSSSEGNSAPTDMDVAPASTMVGGIVAASLPGQPPLQPGMMAPPQLAGMMPGQIPGMMGAPGMPGMPGPVPVATPGGKKEKKKKEKKFIRLAANTAWEDPTLAEWAQDDFRMFCGDLGNEVTDETLVRAFNKYPSFLKAKVVRDRRTNKTKGYGFVSFKDPVDFTRAMREMNGKYVGNRPIKLRKSSWRDRNLEVVRKKEKEKKRLGLK